MKAEARRWLRAVPVGAYALFWVGGIVSYLFLGGPPRGSAWAAPAFLWLAAVLALAGASPRERVWLVACGLLGWGVECTGVATGWPFGGYRYTQVLGPSLLGAPVVMAAAWIALCGYVGRLVPRVRGGRFATAAIGGAWMVALDLLIDPLAAGPLGYWRWEAGGAWHGIPAQNFAGWWIVSTALLAARPAGAPVGGGTVRLTGTSILAFFTVLAAAQGMVGPVVTGVLLLGADAARGACATGGVRNPRPARRRG